MTGGRIAVIGGGWAGLSAATRLSELGLEVTLFERSRALGGRSTSFWEKDFGEWLDHGPHLFIGAYREALRLLELWGSLADIDFTQGDRIPWLMGDGKRHYFSLSNSLVGSITSLVQFDYLTFSEKYLLVKALNKLKTYTVADDDGGQTLGVLLNQSGACEGVVGQFFQTLSLAVMNAPFELVAAKPFSEAVRAGLLGERNSGMIGIPRKPLKEIVGEAAEKYLMSKNVEIVKGCHVTEINPGKTGWNLQTVSEQMHFDGIIIAASPKDIPRLLPRKTFENIFLNQFEVFQFSPIAGIHCSFDLPILDIPFAHLDKCDLHWIFGRGESEAGGWKRVSFIISHAVEKDTKSTEVTALSLIENLKDRLPKAGSARLLNYRFIKNVRATILLTPEVERLRPDNYFNFPGLYAAGDWFNTGLPATIESAARSGRSAAEKLAQELGGPYSLWRNELIPSSKDNLDS